MTIRDTAHEVLASDWDDERVHALAAAVLSQPTKEEVAAVIRAEVDHSRCAERAVQGLNQLWTFER